VFFLSFKHAGLDADGALFFKDLCNEVATNTNQWRAIAVQLHITPTDIDCIDIESGGGDGSVKERFRRVFEKWRRAAHPPFTWDAMITALRAESVDEVCLAQQLEEKHC
jgi:ABC-type amino acid transport substrate-binding protein